MANIQDPERLRPSEAVLRYIEGLQGNRGEEMRLPTVREIARQLGVGASTVSVVYRSLANEGRIRTEVGNGSFLLPARARSRGGKAGAITIGIGLQAHDLDDPQGWLSRIYGGLTIGALRLGQQVSLVPLYLDAPGLEERVGGLDAVVMLPGDLMHQPLIEAARHAGLPVVYLNPPFNGATRNFVSPDYAAASFQLGKAFRAAGRRKVVLLISDPLASMVSAQYRLSGLLAGMEAGSYELQLNVEIADGFSVEAGREAMRRLLEKERPDAVYASGDFLAMGCVEALEECGVDVPGEVSVAGGSGLNLDRYSHPGLTCSAQPYEEVGAELVRMILRLLEDRERDVPGVLVPMAFVGGATTGDTENRHLFSR